MPTMMPVASTPHGDIKPEWREWIDALNTWLNGGTVSPPKPRLYQPAGDTEAVRVRVAQYDGMREGIVQAAENALNAELPDFDAGGGRPHDMLGALSRAVNLANAYLLTGDEKYASHAWEIAEHGMQWPDWIAIEHKPLTIDLRSAAAVHAFAVILDRTDSWLNDERREKLTEYLVNEITRYVEVSDRHAEWWTYSTHNWRTVICGQYGIAALAIMDELPRETLRSALKHSVTGSLVVLDSGDIDGGWFEGVSYWRYGIGEAVQFIDVLHRLSNEAVDLFSHPYLKRTGDFGIHQTLPSGRVFNWADCGDRVTASQLMARLACAHRRPDWQEYVRRFPETPSMETLFWEDCDLAPAPYSELRLVKHFRGSEVATLRAGWEDADLFLGVKAGETTANHSHLDIGSFMLAAHGEVFVGESEHWDYAYGEHFFDVDCHRWDYPGLNSSCHSTLAIEGEGQAYGDEYRGTIVGIGDMGDWAYCTVDATDAYPALKRFNRFFLLIRPDTVVVVDDIESDELVRTGWRVVLPNPVERTDWPVWVSRGDNTDASMTLKWLMPYSDEGIIAEMTQLEARYRSRGGTATPSCRTLTISPMIRQRRVQLAAAMRIGTGEPAPPEVTVEPAYRSLRIAARTDSVEGTWSIMWGQPVVQMFT